MADKDLVITNNGAADPVTSLALSEVQEESGSCSAGGREESESCSAGERGGPDGTGASQLDQASTVEVANTSRTPPNAETDIKKDKPLSPKTNEVLAWVSCILFFWPIGVVAVYKSIKSQKALVKKDYKTAEFEGEAARHFGIGAIVAGILIYIVAGIFLLYSFIVTNNKFNMEQKPSKHTL